MRGLIGSRLRDLELQENRVQTMEGRGKMGSLRSLNVAMNLITDQGIMMLT